MLRTACVAGVLLVACGGGARSPQDAGDAAAGIDLASEPAGPPDAEADTIPDAGLPADATRDGPPTVADLQGGWYATVAVDGGLPMMFRRRFVGGTYYQVSASYPFCAETGSFDLGPEGVNFTPERVVGSSECKLSAAHVEAIAWTEDGIAFGPAGRPTVYRPVRIVPKLFATPELHDGNFAGDTSVPGATAIAKADALCEASLGKPDGQTYKTMLVDGVVRSATPAVDWVLRPNTTYFRPDGTVNVFHTYGTALANPAANNPVEPSSSFYVWTGLGFDFTSNKNACRGWTSGASSDVAGVAYSNSAMWTFVSSSGVPCNYPSAIWCVSQ